MGDDASLRVTVAAAHRRAEALGLLFARHSESERRQAIAEILSAAAREELSLDGLLLAERNGAAVGAVLSVAQADGTMMLWPPAVAPEGREEPVAAEVECVADALLESVWRDALCGGMRMLQVLVDPEAEEDQQRLLRNGFQHVADLQFLERRLDRPLPPAGTSELTTIDFEPNVNTDRFASVLERTYVGTWDCPRLNGARTGAEALRSHQLSGRFEPSRWKLFQSAGSDVGVLLLAEHPERNACEVVYLGVVPEWRGRGFGREMVLAGLRAAQSAGYAAMTLAVDAANLPARRIYRDLGFEQTTVQRAFICLCGPARRAE